MCGLVGFAALGRNSTHSATISKLFLESSIRGLHAFGVAYWDGDVVRTAKFSTRKETQQFLSSNTFLDVIIHSRYATSGDWQDMNNNQPLSVGGYHLVFNGVISMMTKPAMERKFQVTLKTDNDGELFLQHLIKHGDSAAADFIKHNGSFAGLWYNPYGVLFAMRNERRPLWYVLKNGYVFYASTNDIIKRAMGTQAAAQAVECEPYKLYVLEDQAYEHPF